MSAIADTKVCPQCAEEVKDAARECRFCGYQLVPTSLEKTRRSAAGFLSWLDADDKRGAGF
jgi:ribosomal protein L40E